jgi:hypothetical protein
MTDDDGSIYAVLDQAAAGAVGEPPIGAVMAAGRTRLRRRHIAQVATAAVATVVVVVGALALVTHSSATKTAVPAGVGPSTQQLVHGQWEVVAPMTPFGAGGSGVDTGPDPGSVTVWDGRGLVWFGPSSTGSGALELLSLDPQLNRLTTLPAPPAAISGGLATLGGDDQLVLVSRLTGAAAMYRPSTNRWTMLPTLPAKDVISLTQMGSEIVAVTVDYKKLGPHQLDTYHPAHVYSLGPDGWSRLPDLPRPPASSSVSEAPGAMYGGAFYLMTASVQAAGDRAQSPPGSSELLRLGHGGWTTVPGIAGLPKSNFTMHPMEGAILVTGASCTENDDCIPKVSALIRPGRTARVTVLTPPGGKAVADYSVTGGRSTVAVNSAKYWLYDLNTEKWTRGPVRPYTAFNAGAFWTPYGVVSNGGLLRPAPKVSGH